MRDGTSDDSTEIYLQRYISTAIERTKNKHAAVDRLESDARKDKLLWRLLTEPLLRMACQQAIDNFVAGVVKKEPAKSNPEPEPIQVDQRGDRLRFAANSLMGFRLLDGLPLGHAMRSDIVETAASYTRIANSKKRRAKWLTLIADEMPGDKVVGEVFTEDDLKAFKKEAKL